jgi:hypothetical protein
MQVIRVLALAGVLAAAPAAASADVQVSMANGRVSITAKDATVRQILTEWARVGQVKIVNVERIPGGPVTLELKDVPEDQALDLLLRSVAGYLAAPRTLLLPNASRFDRVVVMATAAVPRTPVAGSPQTAQPVFNPAPQPIPDQVAEEEQPAGVAPPGPRGPLFNPFPQPRVVNPQAGGAAVTPGVTEQTEEEPPPAPQMPTAVPGAVSTPGMIVPMPQGTPGQPGAR